MSHNHWRLRRRRRVSRRRQLTRWKIDRAVMEELLRWYFRTRRIKAIFDRKLSEEER